MLGTPGALSLTLGLTISQPSPHVHCQDRTGALVSSHGHTVRQQDKLYMRSFPKLVRIKKEEELGNELKNEQIILNLLLNVKVHL